MTLTLERAASNVLAVLPDWERRSECKCLAVSSMFRGVD